MVKEIPLHSSVKIREFLQQPACGASNNFAGYSDLDQEITTCQHVYITSLQQHESHEFSEAVEHFSFCQASSCFTRSLFQSVRFMSNGLVKLGISDGIARFDVGGQNDNRKPEKKSAMSKKKKKKSKKAKRSELRFFRLKARKRLNSSNPEVRIKYKLEKTKRKEAWLIEKLLKYEIEKGPARTNDPEPLTAEERFYLKRIGQKHKNYVPVGVRGIFGGVILNMHLHWKTHETVKVICKPCKPGQVDHYADEIARLSGGIVIDIMKDNTIIFYRGKNYVRPKIMSPEDTLSKTKALEKYKFEQSLEAAKHFISVLEKELEDYHKHVALYGKPGDQTARTKSSKNGSDAKLNLVDNNGGDGACSYGTVDYGDERVTTGGYKSTVDSDRSFSDSAPENEEDNSEFYDDDTDSQSDDIVDSISESETEDRNLKNLTSDYDFDSARESIRSILDISKTEEC